MINEQELQREEVFWDKVGDKWLAEYPAEQLKVSDYRTYLSGSSVAFDHLMTRAGDLKGLRVLDYGCGSGWLSTYLAHRGAIVEGFDISGKLVQLGMKRADINGVGKRVRLQRMIAEKLDFPEAYFDLVIGISILHHISLEEGGDELFRVVKPGGKALFIEPLGESSFLETMRNYIMRFHHGFLRAVDAEHPLTYSDIRLIGRKFTSIAHTEFQFVEMIARITGDTITRFLGIRALDRHLLKRFPGLRKYCRLVVIEYQK